MDFQARYAAPVLQSRLHPALTLVYGHPSTTATIVNLHITIQHRTGCRFHNKSNSKLFFISNTSHV